MTVPRTLCGRCSRTGVSNQRNHAHRTGKKLHTLSSMCPPVFVADVGQRVLATQKGQPYTSMDAMHDLNVALRLHFSSIYPCHKNSGVSSRNVGKSRGWPLVGVRNQ